MLKPQYPPFRVALTADFYDAAGTPKFADLGLNVFSGQDRIQVTKFNEHLPEITPNHNPLPVE
jgi:hypothetical protein